MLKNGLRSKPQTGLQQPNFQPRLWIFLQATPVTFILIAFNFSIFLAMCGSNVNLMEPTQTDILTWGGNMRSYTLGGDWWRLITNIFVHVGLIHFALNMIALFQLGRLLEKRMGRLTYLFTYFSIGILASLVSLWWNADKVTAGTSGIIFGLFGIFAVLLLTNSVPKTSEQNLEKIIGGIFIVVLAFALYKKIDNPGIIGGFVAGVTFGLLFYAFLISKKSHLLFSLIVLAFSVIICSAFLYLRRDDTKAFQQYIGQISVQEQQALRAQRKFDSSSASQSLVKVNTIILPAWQKNAQIITQAEKLNLNPRQKKVREQLRSYINLQLQQASLFGQYFNGDSNLVKPKLPVVRKQILNVLDSMNKTLSQ